MHLLSVMLVACGALMALETPRTLGLLVWLLTALEVALLAALSVTRLLSAWRARARSRLVGSRQRRWATARFHQPSIESPVSASKRPKGPEPLTPELDGRVLEAAWVFLILAWWLARP